MNREVIVQGNPRVYKALKGQMMAILEELQRIKAGRSVSAELIDIIRFIAGIMNGMKEESK